MATKQTGSNELVTVLWSDTQEEVTMPRRLIVNGNKRAQTEPPHFNRTKFLIQMHLHQW